MNKIVFNNKELIATDIQLPCFIHGHDGAGASQFTISLTANLVALGKKVMFFCARAQGKNSLLAELENNVLDGLLTVEPGNENEFLGVYSRQREKFDYVVVKNIEEYSDKLLEVVAGSKNIILSGDFDKLECIKGLQLVGSQIFFSSSNNLELSQQLPLLEKYEGFLIDSAVRDKIKLQTY